VHEQMRRLNDGRSILDDVSEQAKSMRSTLGSEDRDKLDEYLTSVRVLERRMVNDESWAKKPKPKVSVKPPTDIASAADHIGRTTFGASTGIVSEVKRARSPTKKALAICAFATSHE